MADTTNPVFLLGMLPRTGTNYLRDLLALHPDVAPLEPVHEDHLLRWSNHLVAYVDEVSRSWSADWQVPPSERDGLLRALGDGVRGWVAGHAPGSRVVTKMPSVEHLDNYGRLFPDCPLVIIVRDGRSVVESGVRSFGWTYERGMRIWTRAAQAVLDFDAANRGGDLTYLVVRYEDFLDEPDAQVEQLLTHVGLDPDRYDLEQARDIPVRGSSALRAEQGHELHWNPVERPEGFAPKERWTSWDERRHRRYNHVAGEAHRRLGYDLVEVDGAPAWRDVEAVDLLRARGREAKARLGRIKRAVERELP